VQFSDTHPSDACRFREHSDQLSRGGWWALFSPETETSYISLVRSLAAIPKSQYHYDSDQKPELAGPVLDAFHKLGKSITNLVDQTFGGGPRVFRGEADEEEIRMVKKYLGYGVVPPVLMPNGKERALDPIALINAAYLFYLESLPELMDRISEQDPRKPSDRNKWAERVEMWTLKALEDMRMLTAG